MATSDRDAARAYWESVYGHWPLTPEEVEAELHDYWIALQEVPQAYGALTGWRFTKLNTAAAVIIAAADEERYLADKAGA